MREKIKQEERAKKEAAELEVRKAKEAKDKIKLEKLRE